MIKICNVWYSKKSKFSKKQEGSGILNKIPLLGNILF